MNYKELTQEDYKIWEKLARSEFLDEDFCDAEFLTKLGDKIKGWCLLHNNEWVGCCFISKKWHEYNPKGVHFLEVCTFPKYRKRGYGKYLLKIMFENSVGKTKSVCINPNNIPSIRLFEKYGFKYYCKHNCWNVYKCDANFFPESLTELDLIKLD